MNPLYTALIIMLIIISTFFYGVHIGVVKTELKYQQSSNNSIGSNVNNIIDEANIEDSDVFHFHSCS